MNDEYERKCNNEEVPYVTCEDKCCNDCDYACVYRCNESCKRGVDRDS